MSTSITLTVSPPLSCFVWRPTGPDTPPTERCGRPATVGQAELQPDGTWRIAPICAECVAALVELYSDDMSPLYDDPDDPY